MLIVVGKVLELGMVAAGGLGAKLERLGAGAADKLERLVGMAQMLGSLK